MLSNKEISIIYIYDILVNKYVLHTIVNIKDKITAPIAPLMQPSIDLLGLILLNLCFLVLNNLPAT